MPIAVARRTYAQSPVEELREAVRELEERNHELEALAYAAVHELAAPVRSLQALTQPPAGQGSPAGLTRAVSHVSAVVDGLRALARIGRRQPDRRPFDLADVVDEALDVLEAPTPPSVYVERPLPVVGDRPLVRITMANLLSNAFKSTRDREDASVWVSRRSERGRTVLVVADNGIGLPADDCERAFDPFVRLHPERGDEGVGVGLAIVRAAVEAHGGFVRAAARPGGGTEVRFSLDAAPIRAA